MIVNIFFLKQTLLIKYGVGLSLQGFFYVDLSFLIYIIILSVNTYNVQGGAGKFSVQDMSQNFTDQTSEFFSFFLNGFLT